MFRKLIFLAVVAVVGALPFATASLGARSGESLCFGSPATITGSGTIVGTGGDDVIVGSDGNDVIQGRTGNDKICGGAGDDQIGGGPGDDQIDGGAGNDFVQGGPGNDAILGGEGDDTVQGGADTDSCDGGPGTNTAITTDFEACETVTNASPPATPPTATDTLCFGSPATITGSGTIVGTDGDDVIVGSAGNDFIKAVGGNDKVCGGGGDDRIGGGPGDDQIAGGLGNDNLSGGRGNDAILGGAGDDTIQGGSDTDTCDGGPGANTAVTTGYEACESVTNASPTAAEEILITLKATLAIGQEVPHPQGTRGATGVFNATLTPTGSGATIVWRLTFKKLTGPAVAAHIHSGKPGQAGPVLVPLCGPCAPGAHGTVKVSGQPARRTIVSGDAYVNVHTKRNPGGEVRGQIAK